MQNLRNLNSDVPRKFSNKKTGFSAKQWAQILGVKLPIPDSNAMDTHTDRTVPILGTRNLKAALASPKMIQSNSIKKGAVSPATNKVTWPRIALINLGRIRARLRHALLKPIMGTITRPQKKKLKSLSNKEDLWRKNLKLDSSKWQLRQTRGLKVKTWIFKMCNPNGLGMHFRCQE